MWGMRRKGTLLRKAPPGGVYADLWVGGPNADGRGLDGVNGGHSPAPGLTIVSPSSSTPSSSARFLIRAADGTWRDKQAGVLAGIGGRVWTGSGWSYAGAENVTCLGPLPALSNANVTDTVRRYAAVTGLTVSDAPGGLVQPYSQRCDVAAGESGGGLGVSPYEVFASAASGDQIYWHGVVESTNSAAFAPGFGAYADGEFFDERLDLPQPLSVEGGGTSGQFVWQVRHLGTGPNGGLVVEYWVGQLLTQARTNVRGAAYLLRHSTGAPARTLWIHQHAAYKLGANVGRLYGFPPFMLVASGASASLVAETVRVGQRPWPGCTVVARVDARPPEQPVRGGIGGRIVGGSDGVSTIARVQSTLNTRGAGGSSHASGVPIPQAVVTLGATCRHDNRVQFWHDGAPVGSLGPSQTFDGALEYILQAGADTGHLLMRVRRLLIWPRPLSAMEMQAAHNAIVAAEG